MANIDSFIQNIAATLFINHEPKTEPPLPLSVTKITQLAGSVQLEGRQEEIKYKSLLMKILKTSTAP